MPGLLKNNMKTLEESLSVLKNAEYPEDIFGSLDTTDLKTSYREWCKQTHEDLFPKSKKHLAHEAFVILGKFFQQAEEKLKNKTYGNKNILANKISIVIEKKEYSIVEHLFSGDISEIYRAQADGKDFLVKIARDQNNNSFLKNESDNLKHIYQNTPKDIDLLKFIPKILGSGLILEGSQKKQVNIFEYNKNLVSLAEIADAYPDGIDARDMAWMFNRLLSSLMVCHNSNIIHGAILPNHVLFNLEDHSCLIIDWCFSVKSKAIIKAISPDYKNYYPSEIFVKKPALPKTDLFMAANCIIKLLGGKPQSLEIYTPDKIKNLLRTCLLGYTHRVNDAFEVYKNFGEILTELFGPRKFRIFRMPEKTNK